MVVKKTTTKTAATKKTTAKKSTTAKPAAKTTATKTFHMPENTAVKMDIRGKVTTTTLYTNTFRASVSDSSVFSAEAVGKTFSAPTTSFDEKGKVGTMTNGNPTVSLRNSSDVASRASYIYALSLQYNL